LQQLDSIVQSDLPTFVSFQVIHKLFSWPLAQLFFSSILNIFYLALLFVFSTVLTFELFMLFWSMFLTFYVFTSVTLLLSSSLSIFIHIISSLPQDFSQIFFVNASIFSKAIHLFS